MIREEKFIQGHAPYAVSLDSFWVHEPDRDHGYAWAGVTAVWFRRRRAGYTGPLRTVACAGELREILSPPPADVKDFLARYTDGRYGGRAAARWDGRSLWAPEMGEEERAAYKALLVPMLASFPAAPPLFESWYTFRAVPSR